MQSFDLQGDPVLETFECAGRFGSICGNIRQELRLDARATWEYAAATLSLRARHVGGMEFDAAALGRRATFPTSTIGSHTYFDVEGGYDLTESVELKAGVTNLLDEDPPIVVGTGGTGPTANTFPGVYDPLCRFVHARVTVRF
ncbi:MAG: hypothetical protein ACK52I_28035 [Pseudomonadota bacterium]